MGKTRTAFIGDTNSEKKQEEERRKKKEAKLALKKERVRVPGLKGGERVVAISAESLPEEPATSPSGGVKPPGKPTKHVRAPKKRGKRYMAALLKIDPQKTYAPDQAIDLVRQTSISRFAGKVELHLMLDKKGSANRRIEIQLPHPVANQKKRIEIANDETIKKLEAGKIDFDILVATPEFLPKLVPYAKLLGPKGLMPNPKNGTISQNPQTVIEKFSGGTLLLQTEKDVPVVHTVVGLVSDSTDKLTENLHAILQTVGKQNIQKAVLAPTMGPGIKVALT